MTVPLSPAAAELSPATAVLLQSVRVRTPQLAAVLYDLGFSLLSGKLVFIIGRVAGLTAEVAEEYAREKAMRIHIPVTYDGVPTRELD